MSLREMMHQAGRILLDGATYMHLRVWGQAVPTDDELTRVALLQTSDCCLPELNWDIEALQHDELDLFAGRLFSWAWRDDEIVWCQATDTGLLWSQKFAPWINPRSGNTIGDARIMWEPNRLQQLIGLALLTRNGRTGTAQQAADMLCLQLRSWVRLNPPLIGINYANAMESAQRL